MNREISVARKNTILSLLFLHFQRKFREMSEEFTFPLLIRDKVNCHDRYANISQPKLRKVLGCVKRAVANCCR